MRKNKLIHERIKKLFAILLVAVFSFVLFSPTINALGHDPHKHYLYNNVEGDPWDEQDSYSPPTGNNTYSTFDVITDSFLFYKFGLFWGLQREIINEQKLTLENNERYIIKKIKDCRNSY